MGYRTIIAALAALTCASALADAPCDSKYAYLFSPDARFVGVDLDTFKVTDVGNLWWLSIDEVSGAIQDPTGKDTVLKAKFTERPDESSEGARDMHSLVHLSLSRDRKLRVAEVLRPEQDKAALLDAKILSTPNGRTLLSTYSTPSGNDRVFFVSVFNDKFELVGSLNDFFVLPDTTCLGSDGRTLYTGAGNRILSSSLPGGSVKKYALDNTHLAVADMTPTCRTLVVQRVQVRENKDEMLLHFYDTTAHDLRQVARVPGLGYFSVLSAETILRQGFLLELAHPQLGKEGGYRSRRTGDLSLIRVGDSRTVASAVLPTGSELLGFLCDRKNAIFLGARTLMLLETAGLHIQRKTDIPFDAAFMVLMGAGDYNSRTR